MIFHVLLLLTGLFLNCSVEGRNVHLKSNVCRSLVDYFNIYTNPNCWYNPDVYATPKQVARNHGFHLETYRFSSQDGYIVSMFRVLLDDGQDKNNTRKPVILQHGFGATGTTWIMIGNKSLPFQLVQKGYDVWLPNVRGSIYSLGHSQKTYTDPDYWNFSFQEMGLYDLPTMMDFIQKIKNSDEKIIYIGHSMGTTMSYVYSSVRPKHAEEHVKALISVAPVAYLNHTTTVAVLPEPFVKDLLGLDAIQQLANQPFLQNMAFKLLCGQPSQVKLCQLLHIALAGLGDDQIAAEYLPGFFNHFAEGTSLNTLKHYTDIYASRRFQYFDHGPEMNKILYQSSIPPEFPLDKISVPVHLFYGKRDPLGDEEDVKGLYELLKTSEKSINMVSKGDMYHFSHNDFLLGKHIDIFYEMLFKLMDNLK